MYIVCVFNTEMKESSQNGIKEEPRASAAQSSKSVDVTDFFEGILEHVGQMGTYQILMFIAMVPFGFGWAFSYFGLLFITATPQHHWCYVPELASLGMELRRNLSIPGAADGGGWDHCRVFDVDWAQVLQTLTPPDPGTPSLPCANGWEFDFDDIPYETVVSEREWVCDQANLVPIASALSYVGSAVGAMLFGQIADSFGRITALFTSNLLGCVGSLATAYTSGFWDFVVCRFLVGMSVDSCFMMIYILVMEYVGIKHRTWVANLSIAFFFGGGCMVLPFIALWISDWRMLSIVLAVPLMPFVVAPLLIPESVRWLMSKGKTDKAIIMLRRFEWINKNKIPDDTLDHFVQISSTTKEENQGLKELFKSRSIRSMMLFLVVAYMGVAVVFDVLIRMSETLGLDFFITFAVTSSTEIPAILLLVLLLDRYGRRWLVFAPIAVSGLLSLVAAFVPRGVASVVLAVTARFFNNMAYNTVIQWTPELLPTGLRASGAAVVHVSSFLGVALAPFIVFSERLWEPLPFLIVGVVGVTGGAIALLLPETMGVPIPQTLEEGELLASYTKTCGFCDEKLERPTDVALENPTRRVIDTSGHC